MSRHVTNRVDLSKYDIPRSTGWIKTIGVFMNLEYLQCMVEAKHIREKRR